MRNFYYYIISSGLVGAKQVDPNSYKSTTLLVMSALGMGILVTIFFWLNSFGICPMLNLIDLEVLVKDNPINRRFNLVLDYGLISLIIHYFIIYYRDNAKLIMKNYPQKNGHLLIKFLIVSILIGVISALLTRWLYVNGYGNEFRVMQPFFVL